MPQRPFFSGNPGWVRSKRGPRPWQEADSQGDQPAPVEVPTVAKQAGEAEPPRARRVRWSWVETSIWTDRMLTAFEQGVKGGVKRLF